MVHWPPCWYNIPTRIYARDLERLVFLGRIRHLGLSNFPIEFVKSFRTALAKHDVEIVPYAKKHSITIQAWSTLVKGTPTGKYGSESLPKFTDVRAGEAVFFIQRTSTAYGDWYGY